jgi:hypothetical protein
MEHRVIDTRPPLELGETSEVLSHAAPLAKQISEFELFNHVKYPELFVDINHPARLSQPEPINQDSQGYVNIPSPTVMNSWLRISLPVAQISPSVYLTYLYCKNGTTQDLLCMPLIPFSHRQDNRYKRHRVKDCGYCFVPVHPHSDLSSFRLLTIWIDNSFDCQDGHHNATLQRYRPIITNPVVVSIVIDMSSFEGDCTFSHNWKEAFNDGVTSKNRYYRWNLDLYISDSLPGINLLFAVRFQLGLGDRSEVRFGVKGRKIWCAILQDPCATSQAHRTDLSPSCEPLPTENDSDMSSLFDFAPGWVWMLDESHWPKVLVDRATAPIRAGNGEVSVKTKISVTGVDVTICLK